MKSNAIHSAIMRIIMLDKLLASHIPYLNRLVITGRAQHSPIREESHAVYDL